MISSKQINHNIQLNRNASLLYCDINDLTPERCKYKCVTRWVLITTTAGKYEKALPFTPAINYNVK